MIPKNSTQTHYLKDCSWWKEFVIDDKFLSSIDQISSLQTIIINKAQHHAPQMFCYQPPGCSGYFNTRKQTEDGNKLQNANKGSVGESCSI